MSWLTGPYAIYVLGSYGAAVLILGVMIWVTIAQSRAARRELEALNRSRDP